MDRIEQANGTISNEKKTIAQMIDEVLEQEFPEEKEASIGKNYNDTAQNNADVSRSLQALSVSAAGVRQPVASAGLSVSCLGCLQSPAVWHHAAAPLHPDFCSRMLHPGAVWLLPCRVYSMRPAD